MKKFILPIVALCTVAFVACSGSDKNAEATEAETPEVVEETVVVEEAPACECASEECTGECENCEGCQAAEEAPAEAPAEN